ncbi:DUF4295 family protein [Longibacter sp.]|uniref:DUF4295 family protein n=1 Tax=Longibacter sp. TaxID=2045415 RepID=UPI003EC0A571
MAKTKGKKGAASRKMAKIIVAQKKENGHYSFKQKVVPLDNVQDELSAAKK